MGNTGADGSTGATGATGPAGPSAGFGVPTASASGLPAGSSPTVSVTTDAGSPNTAKIFNFTFGIPKGDQGDQGATGNDGPNVLSTSTATAFTGLVKGNGATVAQATAGTDYAEVFYAEAELSGLWASSSTTVSFSTTFNDIKNAYQADKIVILKLSVSGSSYYYRFPLVRYQSTQVRFSGYLADDALAIVQLTSGNVATYAYDTVDDETYITKGTLDAGIASATQCTFEDTFDTIRSAYTSGKAVVLQTANYQLPLVSCTSSTLRFDALFSTRSMASIGYASTDTTKVSTDISYFNLQQAIHQDGSVTLNGMLKGNGSKVVAAVAGTDYVATKTAYMAHAASSATPSNNPTITFTETYSTIRAWVADTDYHVSLEIRWTGHSNKYILPCVGYTASDITFCGVVNEAAGIFAVKITSDGTVSTTYKAL